MLIKPDNRAKLSQTFAQMKHELAALEQQLETATEEQSSSSYEFNRVTGYLVDEYILAFRLGNITDLSIHLQETFHLAKKGA